MAVTRRRRMDPSDRAVLIEVALTFVVSLLVIWLLLTAMTWVAAI